MWPRLTSLAQVVASWTLHLALAHPAFAQIGGDIANHADDLGAVFTPRVFRWIATSPLAHVLDALRRTLELPMSIRLHTRSQPMIQRCLHEHMLEDPFRLWLTRWPAHLPDSAPALGELELVIARMRLLAVDLQPRVLAVRG